jgi:hypothetical protein
MKSLGPTKSLLDSHIKINPMLTDESPQTIGIKGIEATLGSFLLIQYK